MEITHTHIHIIIITGETIKKKRKLTSSATRDSARARRVKVHQFNFIYAHLFFVVAV